MNVDVLNGMWYLEYGFASRMHNIIMPRLQQGLEPLPSQFFAAANNRVTPNSSPHEPKYKSFYDEDGDYDRDAQELYYMKKAGGGETAVIKLSDTMSRYGFCGNGGNEKLIRILQKAEADSQVKTIVLDVDSPGGTVDSTQELADAYKSLSKPKVTFVRSMMASAALLVGVGGDEVVMNSEITTAVGSIGVLRYHVNAAAMFEKQGIVPKIYRATKSVDKARINELEELTDELKAEIMQSLDEAQKMFEGYVKRGRVGKLTSEEIFTGKMYKRKDALNLGLADRVGGLADAIALSRKI